MSKNIGDEEKPSLGELAHFGVKGMHWGVRKNRADHEVFRQRALAEKNGKPSRKELRAKNKAARAENRAAARAAHDKAMKDRDAEINAARDNLDAAAATYATARQTYKVEKKQIGRVAAKRALNEAGDEYMKTWHQANELTAREQNIATTIDIGLAVAQGFANASKAKQDQRNQDAFDNLDFGKSTPTRR